MFKLNELDSISHAQSIVGYSKLSELLHWRPLIMFKDPLSQRRSGDTWVPFASSSTPPHMPQGWSRVERVERSIVPHFCALLRGNDTSFVVRPRSSSTSRFCAPGGRASPLSSIICLSRASAKQQRRREASGYEISNVEIDILRNKLQYAYCKRMPQRM